MGRFVRLGEKAAKHADFEDSMGITKGRGLASIYEPNGRL